MTFAVLAATGVQIAVWVAIGVATASMPWWLRTVLAGALVIGLLRLLDNPAHNS